MVVSNPQFTDYDAYFSTTDGLTSVGLIEYEGEQAQQVTQQLPLRAARADSSPTEFEQYPGYGDVFGQGDFSHGAGQRRFHAPGRDAKKFWYSEGVDISDPGKLKLLHDIGTSVASATIGQLEICNGLPFVIDNTGASRVKRGNGSFPGSWTTEDPGGGAVTISGLTSSGDELYAAQTNVYKRTSAGVWSSYVTAGATAIDRIVWTKDRLIVADGRNIYEITASGALPTAMETLPTGWRFEAIWEYGEYVYAAAINTNDYRSKIHHYGPNQDYSRLEKKGQSEIPRGQLIYSGSSYLGAGYLGGGVVDKDTTTQVHPIVYQCFADARGFLSLVKLREDNYIKNVHGNDPVKAFEPYGEAMLYGWNDYDDITDGAIRAGLGVHYPARDAVANHLVQTQSTGSSKPITSIRIYKGRILFTVSGNGLYYEDLANYVTVGSLTTSFADFNTAGSKIWDEFSVAHSPIVVGQAVEVHVSLDPEGFTTYGPLTSNTVGEKGRTVSDVTNNLRGRVMQETIYLRGGTDPTLTPILYSVSARSNPSPDQLEFVLTRTFRLLSIDQKDDLANVVYGNPDNDLAQLYDFLYTWVSFQEPNAVWTALVTNVMDVTPMIPEVRTSGGNDPARKARVVQIQMVAH